MLSRGAGRGGGLGGVLSTLAAGRIFATCGYVPAFTIRSVVHPTAFGALQMALRLQAAMSRVG